MTADESVERGIGHAVEHLSNYYRHLATLSAGAIVVIGTFASEFGRRGPDSALPAVAIGSLGACILVSTYMMWAYGVARRQVAQVSATSDGAWAYQVRKRVVSVARIVVIVGSFFGPLSFVVGFLALALYAAQVL
jgi:hypothetical protein